MKTARSALLQSCRNSAGVKVANARSSGPPVPLCISTSPTSTNMSKKPRKEWGAWKGLEMHQFVKAAKGRIRHLQVGQES